MWEREKYLLRIGMIGTNMGRIWDELNLSWPINEKIVLAEKEKGSAPRRKTPANGFCREIMKMNFFSLDMIIECATMFKI